MPIDATPGALLLVRSLAAPGRVFGSLKNPGAALRFAAWLFGCVALVGGATAGIQLVLLDRAIGAIADPAMQVHVREMQTGFVRLIVCDRLLPPATLVLAFLLCGFFTLDAERIPAGGRRAVWAVLLVGFAPLLVARTGELAATVIGARAITGVGEVVSLPRTFRIGPALFGGPSPPVWLEALNSRFNLETVWTALLWAGAAESLERSGRFGRHLGVAVTSLVLAGVTTWVWGPRLVALVLRGWW